MTLSPQQRSEFEDLLHALCEDMLDDAGEARLSELLAGHEDARTLYIEALAMHADLAWDLRERGRVSIPASSLADSDETGTPVSTPVRVPRKAAPVLGFLGDIMQGNLHLPGSASTLWTLVALLLCTFTLGLLFVATIRGILPPHAQPGHNQPDIGGGVPQEHGLVAFPVARLTRAVEGCWGHTVPAPGPGTTFVAGQKLSLCSGAIELDFGVGVRAVVQGPAKLDLVSPSRVFLRAGKISAEIMKPEARGFQVETPKGSVVDLGTEFGVEVTPSEDVQVHVFKGEVVVEQPQKAQRGGSQPEAATKPAVGQHLLVNQGLRMEGGLATPWLVRDSGETFIRKIEDATRDRHVVAYWRFEDQPLGTALPDTEHNTNPVRATVDSSFNGNDLYTFAVNHRPTFSPAVPAAQIPLTGSPNRSCLDSSEPTDPQGARNVYTHSKFSHASPLDIQKIIPAQWTIEASVNSIGRSGEVQTFLGRDTYFTFEYRSEPPRLAFQINADQRFAIIYYDAENRRHQAIAEKPLVEASHWYHLAAVSDGRLLRLYVDALDGRGYVLRASTQLPAQGSTALGKGEDTAEWSIGRGRSGSNTGEFFLGLIDEVRISDIALSPSDFLFTAKGKKSE